MQLVTYSRQQVPDHWVWNLINLLQKIVGTTDVAICCRHKNGESWATLKDGGCHQLAQHLQIAILHTDK